MLVWLHDSLPKGFELFGAQPGGADAYVRNPGDGQGLTLVEVKTHDERFWRRNGRLVNADQLKRMSADLIMWCVAPEPLGCSAVLVGWSPVDEVRSSGTPERTGVHRNVRVHAPLRSPGRLMAWLSSGRSGGWPEVG